MSILRWDAARDLMFVHDRINKLFEYALANLDVDIRIPSPWMPACDVYENSKAFMLKAETPGLTLSDIALEINGDTVTLVGVRKRSREISEESYHRVERSFGRFVRNFVLPCSVDESTVTAALKDGLLTVTLPKDKSGETGGYVNVKVE